ncbi:MAG: hypothetical protein V4533_01215 [Pseudomonadota bacterium]|jgi:hypothetical protein|uniref:hypothetical protein n=1 Tax=Sphingobium sp. CECT 9361 TaxID=2845384 RepID=UPI001E5924BE|nr:hypothetical protein [Sphingobium sp. CECT 9361]CAH0356121.1 hypothetical protein SPH9361_03891 [Sphingobium sp. CECT 9361]
MAHVDPHAASLYGAIAEEIRDLRTIIEELAHTLLSDEAFVMAYIEQFQVFDLLVQRASESADLLDRMAEGAKSHDAIDQVRLSMVQDKLRSALSAAA